MKELVFLIPDELADKFELTVKLTGDNKNALGEGFVREYLARALQSAADSFRAPDAPQMPPPAAANAGSPPPPPAPQRTPIYGTPNHRQTPPQHRDLWQE